MRLARLFAVTLGVAALVAIATPGRGLSDSSAKSPQQECGHIENMTGLEVVFGRFQTDAAAQRFRARIIGQGFLHAAVIHACDFRVVVRGIETFDIAVDLQSEARTVYYKATVECVKGLDSLGEIEVVFGHRRDRVSAADLVQRAALQGFTGLQLEPDPCGGFEIMIKGFDSRSQAEDFVAEANRAGFITVIEES